MPGRDDSPSDLLFGLLAERTGLIDVPTLLEALRDREGGRSLAEALVGRGALDPATASTLGDLVDRHVVGHGGDPASSLSAVAIDPSLRTRLEATGDPELIATLPLVGATAPWSGPSNGGGAFEVGPAEMLGGRFRVLRPHARGGIGEVSVALDTELNREVALKQIKERHADDPASRARFVLEAEVTGGLEHPGIVPVYGLGHDDLGRPYYAMRFIRGESLRDALLAYHDEAPRLDPGARALRLRQLLGRFIDVCQAIGYAHERGVLHRDLKPGNIMVGKYGETLVVDWGLAKATGRPDPGALAGERALVPTSAGGSAETMAGAPIGTPAYMSPEQAAGDLDRLGPRSDVYSLGATLYCLLTGRQPFAGEDILGILADVRAGDFPTPRRVDPTIDPPLEAICLKAMALRPEDRYDSTRGLADDVERWLADEPVAAWPEPWIRRAARWARRHRPAVASAAALLVAATVALGVGATLIDFERRKTGEARDTATREAERARKAEGRALNLLAASYADAARLAAQRGAWRPALAHYDRAIAAGHPDTVALRLGKVRAWVALDEAPAAFRELEALGSRTDLGRHRGEVLLWRADLGHARDLDASGRDRLLQEALAAGLDPADAAYARGLLAETSPDALTHFRKALELDPFHNRASDLLGWTLGLLGRRVEALDVVRQAELLFPDDPAPRVTHALLLASDGDRAGANAQLDHAAERTGPAAVGRWRPMAEFLVRCHDADARIVDPTGAGGDPVRDIMQIWSEFLAAQAAYRPAPNDDRNRMTALDFPPRLSRAFGRLQRSALTLAIGLRRPLIDELDRTLRVHPEGTIAFFRGTLLLLDGRHAEAEPVLLAAAEMPSLIDSRHMARLVALQAQSFQLPPAGDAPAGLRDRTRANLRVLASTGIPDPSYARLAALVAARVGEIDLARLFLSRSRPDPAAEADNLAARAYVDLLGQSFASAISSAKSALRLSPGHSIARPILTLALDGLRNQALALAPVHESPPKPSSNALYDLASSYALCASAPKGDRPGRPLAPDEVSHRRRFNDLALAALRAAHASGFRDRTRLLGDPDFAPLRVRPDFQALVLDCGFPANPIAR
ncbi:MAG TPA: protein kinase [Isosphaeraceae bacterium]|jgi:tetratricopeptide (TPR) repeat protein/tRNA A-37 threonylcarbamoyl transferase component Bud32|nr:protein kinase [Isosphaeraceae bacterium]